MLNIDESNQDRIIQQIRQQCRQEKIRLSIHGHQEMVKEDISYNELCEAITEGKVIENYPNHERGPCCLLCGKTEGGRFLHIVCTT